MIGQFCTVSTHRHSSTVCPEDMKGLKTGLSDYVCPECGGQRYHLVFRVEALSHRVTLSIACEVCSVRKHLLEDTYGPEQQYGLEMVADNHGGPPHS